MLQAYENTEPLTNMSTASLIPYPSDLGSSIAEIVDQISSDNKGPSSRRISFPVDPQDPPPTTEEEAVVEKPTTLALLKSSKNSPLFWVPAQLHPEIAPNEFNTWLDKRASALNLTEKRATRRKSILSISSTTSEQLKTQLKTQLDALPEMTHHDIPNSTGSLQRRRTYNDNNRRELLVKKDKDEFILVPKTENLGLKRSARAKPRKDSSRLGRRNHLASSSEFSILSKDEFDKPAHRKTASEALDPQLISEQSILSHFQSQIPDYSQNKTTSISDPKNPKDSTPNQSQPPNQTSSQPESSLLSEIASMLSMDLFDRKGSEQTPKSVISSNSAPTSPTPSPSTLKSAEAEDVLANRKEDLSTSYIKDLRFFTSKSSQDLSSIQPIETKRSPSVPILPAISRKNSISSEKTLTEEQPAKEVSSINIKKANSSEKPTKKGFSWFRSSDSEDPDKKASAKNSAKSVIKESPVEPKPVSTENSKPKISTPVPIQKVPVSHNRKKSNNLRDMMGDGISSDVQVSFNPSNGNIKNKDKSKKLNFFFLNKDKEKPKKDDKERRKERSKNLSDSEYSKRGPHNPSSSINNVQHVLYDPCDLPLHVEQALYRLSHQKLSNPRRPLTQQVVISNLMLAYLRVVNPNFRMNQPRAKSANVPKPRSPHLLSKERYQQGRRAPIDSSSDEEEDDSFTDSSSDDEDLVSSTKKKSN